MRVYNAGALYVMKSVLYDVKTALCDMRGALYDMRTALPDKGTLYDMRTALYYLEGALCGMTIITKNTIHSVKKIEHIDYSGKWNVFYADNHTEQVSGKDQ